MKIYLAAMYSRRAEMERVADCLKSRGFEITARWVYGGEEGKTRRDIALIDLEDIDKADAVVSFTEKYRTATIGGGRHVEFGFALATGKRVIVIGDRENVFHHHPLVEVFPDVDSWTRHELPCHD